MTARPSVSMTPTAAYLAVLDDLDASIERSIAANKPTMWAYYWERRRDLLAALVGGWSPAGEERDADILEGCRRWERQAELCGREAPPTAARRWARSVYARRILALCGEPVQRRSLDWLRARRWRRANTLSIARG